MTSITHKSQNWWSRRSVETGTNSKSIGRLVKIVRDPKNTHHTAFPIRNKKYIAFSPDTRSYRIVK